MDFKTLAYFISVAETLNFSKTAEQFDVTQTAISLAISKMEHEIGFSLFDRSNRPISLTEAGAFFYGRAQKLLKNYEFSVKCGREINDGFSGTLKIAVPSMFEALVVMGKLKKYQQNHERFEITFSVVPTSQVAEYLKHQKTDAAICCSEVVSGEPGIVSRNFCPFTYCVAMQESRQIEKGTTVRPADLVGKQLVTLQDTSLESERHMRKFCTEVGLDFRNKIRVLDIESMIFHIGINNSYGLVPDYFKPYIQAEIVCLTLEADALPKYHLALCYRNNDNKTALQRFYYYLQSG